MNPLLAWFLNQMRPLIFRWLLLQNCPLTKDIWFQIIELKGGKGVEIGKPFEATMLYQARVSDILSGLSTKGAIAITKPVEK